MLRKLRLCIALGAMRLGERRERTLYLVATLAVTVLAIHLLSVFAARFTQPGNQALGFITVVHARAGAILPLAHAQRIERMTDVAHVAHMNVLGLLCKPPVGVAALNAWGGSSEQWRTQFPDVPADTLAAWQADPMAILVGAQLAHTCGWRRGMTLQPPELMTGQPTEVRVAGVFNASAGRSEQIAIAHYEYVNRLLPAGEQDKVRIIRVHGTDPGRLPELANRIEAEFAADSAPVQANTSSEAESALGRFGNVQALLRLVMVAMMLCALLVLVSTLAHLAAERRASMAMLQALGFGRGALLGGLVFELSLIVATGALLGLAAARLVLSLLAPRVAHLLGALPTPPATYLWFGLSLLGLAVLALLIPGRTIAHLRPTDHEGV